jgi:hypothetical protein
MVSKLRVLHAAFLPILLLIKADIVASLRSRLDIILDDDEVDDDSTTNHVENSPSQKATQVIFHELRYLLSSGQYFCFE